MDKVIEDSNVKRRGFSVHALETHFSVALRYRTLILKIHWNTVMVLCVVLSAKPNSSSRKVRRLKYHRRKLLLAPKKQYQWTIQENTKRFPFFFIRSI